MQQSPFCSPASHVIQTGFAAKDDKNRHQAFIRGDVDETRLIQRGTPPARNAAVLRRVRRPLVPRRSGRYGYPDGRRTRPTLKSDAENVVKHIEGVTKVVNQIEVLPLSPEDDRIRMAEYRAIFGDPTLATRYGYRALPSIHIIVKNGHVTLDGVGCESG